MTRVRRQQAAGDSGFSLVESLVALLLMLVVTGAVFGLVNPNTIASQTQPEAMDMQQRARVASDLLVRDLFMAGAGVYSGPAVGALINSFAPIVPRRMGMQNADNYAIARGDAVTILYVASTYAQTTLRDPLPQPSSDLTVDDRPNCPRRNEVCGFEQDTVILIFDAAGQFDFFTVRQIQGQTAQLQPHQQGPSVGYQPGAYVTQAESHTYWHDPVRRQLRHYDGYQTDAPVVDNVVAAAFEYFGDPEPPTLPKPPLGTANCLYDAAGNLVSGLARLAAQGGSLAPLPLSILSDGPWCGAGGNRFDADLLRVRSVRVTLRVQATQAAFRGTGSDYAIPGFSRSALRNLPDYTVRFDVTPRNMNLAR